jgi:hypothetical protein
MTVRSGFLVWVRSFRRSAFLAMRLTAVCESTACGIYCAVMDIITDRYKARILSGATFLAGAVLVVLPLLAGPGYLPVIAFPALAGVGYLTVRAWRSRLEVGQWGMRIYKVWSTSVVAPADFDGLDWGVTLSAGGLTCLIVRRKSGHGIKVPAVRPVRKSMISGTPTPEEMLELTARVERGMAISS